MFVVVGAAVASAGVYHIIFSAILAASGKKKAQC